MIKKVGIFYFSGTKVTEAVSKTIHLAFNSNSIEVDLFKIENILLDSKIPKVDSYDIIGIGYPIHAFDAPEIVYDFLKILPNGNSKKAFIFKSAGSESLNAGSTKFVRRKLLKKGYDVVYEKLYVITTNFMYNMKESVIRDLYKKSIEESKILVNDILNNNIILQKNNVFLNMFSFIFSNFEGLGTKFMKFHFRVSRDCINCKVCINNCPRKNIYEKANKIKFKSKCILCMRCFYSCPKKAISLLGFNFIISKEWVDIDEVLKDEIGKL